MPCITDFSSSSTFYIFVYISFWWFLFVGICLKLFIFVKIFVLSKSLPASGVRTVEEECADYAGQFSLDDIII